MVCLVWLKKTAAKNHRHQHFLHQAKYEMMEESSSKHERTSRRSKEDRDAKRRARQDRLNGSSHHSKNADGSNETPPPPSPGAEAVRSPGSSRHKKSTCDRDAKKRSSRDEKRRPSSDNRKPSSSSSAGASQPGVQAVRYDEEDANPGQRRKGKAARILKIGFLRSAPRRNQE